MKGEGLRRHHVEGYGRIWKGMEGMERHGRAWKGYGRVKGSDAIRDDLRALPWLAHLAVRVSVRVSASVKVSASVSARVSMRVWVRVGSDQGRLSYLSYRYRYRYRCCRDRPRDRHSWVGWNMHAHHVCICACVCLHLCATCAPRWVSVRVTLPHQLGTDGSVGGDRGPRGEEVEGKGGGGGQSPAASRDLQ